MPTRPALVLAGAAAVIVAIGCSSTAKPSAPAPVAQAPTRQTQQQPAPTLPTTPTDSTDTPAGGGAGRGGRGGAAGGGQGAATNPLPYARVVTAQAQTRAGLFKVHRIGERVLFEIPRRELNKDILLVQEIAQTTLGAGYGGQAAGNRMLRFERRDNRVLLRGISNEIMASDTTSPVAGAVRQ